MKKYLSGVLAFLILCSCAVSAFAENGIDGLQQKSIEISYTVAGNYEISIPSGGISDTGGIKELQFEKDISLVPAEGKAVASFTMQVHDVRLEKDTLLRISVKSENEFFLKLPNGAAVQYTLTGADEDGTVMLIHSGETEEEKTLTITLADVSGLNYAGTYYDKLTFECEILPAE